MKFINLTPHAINVIGHAVFPPSGIVARVSQVNQIRQVIDGIPLFGSKFAEVVDLPTQKSDVFLIVSAMVKAASSRDDLVSPTELVRDSAGNVVGCKGFSI